MTPSAYRNALTAPGVIMVATARSVSRLSCRTEALIVRGEGVPEERRVDSARSARDRDRRHDPEADRHALSGPSTMIGLLAVMARASAVRPRRSKPMVMARG